MHPDGGEEFRSHEFYDNVDDHGGGWASSRAIQGHVIDITYGAAVLNIVAFKVQATVTNDTPGLSDWLEGDNSHGEMLTLRDKQYVGPLYGVKMAAEFAIADTAMLPPMFTPPYRLTVPFIIAENEDQFAWYCYSTLPSGEPGSGRYYVPVWDFGDIDDGGSATLVMEFRVDGAGLDPTDPRYAVIEWSYEMGNESDILLNRTTSLKISTWIDDPAVDDGTPYPGGLEEPPLRSSNASVFHNIAPIYYKLELIVKNPDYGWVDVFPNWVLYPPGAGVTLTAFPDPNRSFGKYKIWDDPNNFPDPNYVDIDANEVLHLTMNNDYLVEAVFKCSSGSVAILPMMLGVLGLFMLVRRSR
jgi:hypothetical protein